MFRYIFRFPTKCMTTEKNLPKLKFTEKLFNLDALVSLEIDAFF